MTSATQPAGRPVRMRVSEAAGGEAMRDLIEDEPHPTPGTDDVIVKGWVLECETVCPRCGGCLQVLPFGGP